MIPKDRLEKAGRTNVVRLGSYVPEDKNGATSTSSNIEILRCW